MKAGQLVFALCILGSALGDGCPAYYCDVKVPGLVTKDPYCGVYYAGNSTIYYSSNACQSDQSCPAVLTESVNCVNNGDPVTITVYPGDKCGKDYPNRQCNHGDGACKNSICVGYDLDQECAKDTDCNPTLYCKVVTPGTKGTCVSLVNMNDNCTKNAMCPMDGTCSMKAGETNGKCLPNYSIKAGQEVDVCSNTESALCETGYCYQKDNLFYCQDYVKSAKKLPVACTTDTDCTSTKDSTTGETYPGKCVCGRNNKGKSGNKPAGQSYCNLFIGDSPVQKGIEAIKKMVKSSDYNKCNTGRRYASALICVTDWFSKKLVAEYNYAMASFTSYPLTVYNDDCVKKYLSATYWQAKKAWDDEDGAFGLLMSLGLVLALF